MQMNPSFPVAGSRLRRLEGYLRQDPGNAELLAEACEAALAAGDHERALVHVAAAERLALDPRAWAFRRAAACIAGRDLDQAEALLRRLLAAGEHPVVSHDLGYVALLRRQFDAVREIVRPWLAKPEIAPQHLEALQVLWLRASHALHLLEPSLAWLQDELSLGRLQPRARGPAALIAVDSSRFDLALMWSDQALAADPLQSEALLARACVAMAQQQPEKASELLEEALRRNPAEGRLWSALGYASLQARELPKAQAQLERAVALMPSHIGTRHALGWVHLLQQDLPGARAAFAQALEIDRNFAESHGALALVLALAGERPKAEEHLLRAHRLDKANVTGRYARALLAGEVNDPGQLMELASRLLDQPGFFGGTLGDALRAHPPAR